jgi:hypothetical protein
MTICDGERERERERWVTFGVEENDEIYSTTSGENLGKNMEVTGERLRRWAHARPGLAWECSLVNLPLAKSFSRGNAKTRGEIAVAVSD